MASWDRLDPAAQSKTQEAALRTQVVDAVGPFSPFWRARFAAVGRTPASCASLAGLRTLPSVGERDLCPDGNPVGAAGLVLQAGETGFALHAAGPTLRRALGRRLVAPGSYRAVVEADTRPTSYVFAGSALRFPVASTRSDLDIVARAGARLWQVLGLTSSDVVVSALRPESTALQQALALAALASGSPLLAPGAGVDDVVDVLSLVAATVLVVPPGSGAELVRDLEDLEAPLAALTTVLVAGAPYDDEREDLVQALATAAPKAIVLALHVPDGHRLLWGECRASAGRTGLHSYPDLEILDAVDPETGETVAKGGGELALTQLGLHGSALLRWRTGDLVAEVSSNACPSCGRTVPRAVALQRGALVPELLLRTGARSVDLRAVCSALGGRPDVADWRVVLGRSGRDGADQLLVHVTPGGGVDPADVAVALARDVRLAAGLLPTQVVVDERAALPAGSGLTRRILT